jgi:hypothetical protein
MEQANNFTKKRCARCHELISGRARFEDKFWWHEKCYQNGARELANAMRIALPMREESTITIIFSRSDDCGSYAPEEVIGDDFYGPTIF